MDKVLGLMLLIAFAGAGCQTGRVSSESPQDQSGQAGGLAQQATKNDVGLDLSDRGLKAIPDDVFSRTDLEWLDLSGNRLTGAPQAEIRHLSKLKYLDLSDNSLTGLPAELGQLKGLENLDVSNNKLTGLPMELGNLTDLRVFDITGNAYSARDLEEISRKLPNTEIKR